MPDEKGVEGGPESRIFHSWRLDSGGVMVKPERGVVLRSWSS